MTLIDGKAISEQIKQEIAAEVAERVARGEKRPHLAAILVGHDGGSETYVANKVKACEVCGFTSSLIRFESDVTEETLLAEIDRLNQDADVDGFIVQLPASRLGSPVSCQLHPTASCSSSSATTSRLRARNASSSAVATSWESPWLH